MASLSRTRLTLGRAAESRLIVRSFVQRENVSVGEMRDKITKQKTTKVELNCYNTAAEVISSTGAREAAVAVV